jgi:hypothetical protein
MIRVDGNCIWTHRDRPTETPEVKVLDLDSLDSSSLMISDFLTNDELQKQLKTPQIKPQIRHFLQWLRASRAISSGQKYVPVPVQRLFESS